MDETPDRDPPSDTKVTPPTPQSTRPNESPERDTSWIFVIARLLDDHLHGRTHPGTQLWSDCQENTRQVHRRVVGVFDRIMYPFVWLSVVLYHVTSFLQKNMGGSV